jgi:hypothetical protein
MYVFCRWYDENNIVVYGVTLDSALRAYFVAAANIFEPDRAAERLAWARTAMIVEAVSRHLRGKASADSTREALISALEKNHPIDRLSTQILLMHLYVSETKD